MRRMLFSQIFLRSYVAGYVSISLGFLITCIISKVITIAPMALKAFLLGGIWGSIGLGFGVFIAGITVGLAYNKLIDSINSLRNALSVELPDIDRCKGLLRTITIFKYLTFGLLSKSIDNNIISVAFRPNNHRRSYEIVRFLVDEGLKPSNTDLYAAILNGNSRLVKLLLQNGCNPNYVPFRNEPDMLTIVLGRVPLSVEIINALIDSQAKVNAHHIGRLNNAYVTQAEGYINQNEKAKISLKVLHLILSHQSSSIEEKTRVQNLLNHIHDKWAAEIGPVLAKGQVPIYEGPTNSQIQQHREDSALKQVFGNTDTASYISSFLGTPDLANAKQVAKVEEN